MATTFTPGPWTVGYKAFEVTAYDGQMKVCDIRGWGYLTGKGAMALTDAEGEAIQIANAHLIAAAPELYETLAWVRANYAAGSTTEINARIDAALTRALAREISNG